MKAGGDAQLRDGGDVCGKDAQRIAVGGALALFLGRAHDQPGIDYSCRRIAGSSTPSQHSSATRSTCEFYAAQRPRHRRGQAGWFAFRERGLLNNVRSGGCNYFSTVLGPGYNAAHADHFHFRHPGPPRPRCLPLRWRGIEVG